MCLSSSSTDFFSLGQSYPLSNGLVIHGRGTFAKTTLADLCPSFDTIYQDHRTWLDQKLEKLDMALEEWDFSDFKDHHTLRAASQLVKDKHDFLEKNFTGSISRSAINELKEQAEHLVGRAQLQEYMAAHPQNRMHIHDEHVDFGQDDSESESDDDDSSSSLSQRSNVQPSPRLQQSNTPSPTPLPKKPRGKVYNPCELSRKEQRKMIAQSDSLLASYRRKLKTSMRRMADRDGLLDKVDSRPNVQESQLEEALSGDAAAADVEEESGSHSMASNAVEKQTPGCGRTRRASEAFSVDEGAEDEDQNIAHKKRKMLSASRTHFLDERVDFDA